MDINYLNDGPISPETISRLIEKMNSRTDCGGQMIFLGQVRADKINGKMVKAIEYSAYIELVATEVEKIKKSIFTEFNDVKNVDIIHSTGIVAAGQISLLVLVSAGHRNQAFQACGKTVELIKQNLPVWKKEIYDDKSHKWI